MKPQCYVRLVIVDDENGDLASEVTQLTGLSPSTTWRKGEKPTIGIRHKEHGWELKSALPLEAPVLDHIEFLLSSLEPVREQLLSLTLKYCSQLGCGINIYDESPELVIDNALLRRIAELNLSLDIDIYCLPED